MSIARTQPIVASRHHARTGGQRGMIWKPYGDARVWVASDADVNNLETQRSLLADCGRPSMVWAAGPHGTSPGRVV